MPHEPSIITIEKNHVLLLSPNPEKLLLPFIMVSNKAEKWLIFSKKTHYFWLVIFFLYFHNVKFFSELKITEDFHPEFEFSALLILNNIALSSFVDMS